MKKKKVDQVGKSALEKDGQLLCFSDLQKQHFVLKPQNITFKRVSIVKAHSLAYLFLNAKIHVVKPDSFLILSGICNKIMETSF